MATASSDRYTCRLISPRLVLDDGLDEKDLALVRGHLRLCEDCRGRVEVFRERQLRESRLKAAKFAARGLMASARKRASAQRDRLAHSRRYAMVALMAALVGGFFVSSSQRLSADDVKQTPTLSARLAAGSVEATNPSAVPSPSATSEPSALPATSQDRTVPTVVVPSAHPAPAPRPASTLRPRPASTSAPVDARPAVILTVTPRSGLAPLTVTADASRSSDTDATQIAAYDFDFGDGTPHAWGAAAQHKYCVVGIYRLTVIVTDSAGLRSSAYVYVEVTQPVNQILC